MPVTDVATDKRETTDIEGPDRAYAPGVFESEAVSQLENN